MVPILGPSTLRDLPARFVGRKINIIDINSGNWDTVDSEWIALLNTAEILSINEEMLPRYESVKKDFNRLLYSTSFSLPAAKRSSNQRIITFGFRGVRLHQIANRLNFQVDLHEVL